MRYIPRFVPVIIGAVFLLTVGVVYAVVREHQISRNEILNEELDEEVEEPEEQAPSRAELITGIIAAAYPDRIEKVEFRNDDWAVLLDGIWFYYTGGKMLPEDLLDKADDYTGSFGIPAVQRDLPPWKEPTPEESERYRARYNNNTNNNNNAPRDQRQRTNHFRDTLWGASSRNESSQRVRSINFLGKTLVIHSDLAGVLALVEQRITAIAKNDPVVQSWITNIGELHGWNWRNVAGSQSRSNHSYGIAIDILPKSLNGKETYWQWAAERGREWWNIPYEERYHPPDAVVKTFEAYGFMWGGKWQAFDTMHFEYRPESFILSGLELAAPR